MTLPLFLWVFSISPVFAALEKIPEKPVSTIEGVNEIIDKVAKWIFNILLSVATIVLLLAGFQWLTSGGNEEKISSARKNLIWALVGILVALLAKGLVAIIKSLVGST